MVKNALTPSRNAVVQPHAPEHDYVPLVERISSSAAFRRAGRLRDLLHYLAEMSAQAKSDQLTEQRIGQAVFGKPTGYSPVEDSSVRVHIRQLRLKLHEYFDSEGRDEPLILTIPKGSYSLSFQAAASAAPDVLKLERLPVAAKKSPRSLLPWFLVAVLAVLSASLWYRAQGSAQTLHPSWPLSDVLANGYKTQIVLADATYGMERVLSNKPVSLEGYIRRDFQKEHASPRTGKEAFLMQYAANALLTSWADVAIADNLLRLMRGSMDDVSVRSARDLQPRDLQEGNYIFVGSPAANPWVSLFESRLNFSEIRSDEVSGAAKSFRNKNPRPGEQLDYEGLPRTGFGGYDFASVSLLPGETRRGNIMIIQGLQQESTEAAGMMLTDDGGVQKLKRALGIKGQPSSPVYFEVLLRIRAVAGAPNSVDIVATRAIQP